MRGSTCRLACTFQGSSPMAAISSSAEEDRAEKSGRSGGLGGQEAKGSGSRAQSTLKNKLSRKNSASSFDWSGRRRVEVCATEPRAPGTEFLVQNALSSSCSG
jgi:hypothetical protein